MNQLVEAIRSGALREPHREDHFFLKVEEIGRCLVKGPSTGTIVIGSGLQLPPEIRSNRRFFGCHRSLPIASDTGECEDAMGDFPTRCIIHGLPQRLHVSLVSGRPGTPVLLCLHTTHTAAYPACKRRLRPTPASVPSVTTTRNSSPARTGPLRV
jgi:hypothetical protein